VQLRVLPVQSTLPGAAPQCRCCCCYCCTLTLQADGRRRRTVRYVPQSTDAHTHRPPLDFTHRLPRSAAQSVVRSLARSLDAIDRFGPVGRVVAGAVRCVGGPLLSRRRPRGQPASLTVSRVGIASRPASRHCLDRR